MGLLDGMMGQQMGGMQENPFAQYQQMQANPFTRQIPGTEYLSGFGQMGGGLEQPMGGQGMDQGGAIPTDFTGVPPGLPNLPENLQGFGFGQSAPEMNVNSNLRQNLIQQLLQQLMGSQAGGFNGGFMGGQGGSMPGMGGMQNGGF